MSHGPDSGPGGGRSGRSSMDLTMGDGGSRHPRPTPLADIGEDEGVGLGEGREHQHGGSSKRKHRRHRDRDGDGRVCVVCVVLGHWWVD